MKSKRPYEKKRMRVGRGIGSGTGKTSARGQKGQGSRSGSKWRRGFEGGQNPIYRRLPKRGFNHARFRREYAIVNLTALERIEDSEVTPEKLLARGVVSDLKAGLKILGDGEVRRALTVKAHRFSKSAAEKIQKAGGQAVVLER